MGKLQFVDITAYSYWLLLFRGPTWRTWTERLSMVLLVCIISTIDVILIVGSSIEKLSRRFDDCISGWDLRFSIGCSICCVFENFEDRARASVVHIRQFLVSDHTARAGRERWGVQNLNWLFLYLKNLQNVFTWYHCPMNPLISNSMGTGLAVQRGDDGWIIRFWMSSRFSPMAADWAFVRTIDPLLDVGVDSLL